MYRKVLTNNLGRINENVLANKLLASTSNFYFVTQCFVSKKKRLHLLFYVKNREIENSDILIF